MQEEFIERIIVDSMRRHRKSLVEARDEAVRGLGLTDTTIVDHVVAAIRAEGRKNQLLDIPGGVEADSYRTVVATDVKEAPWYVGERKGDTHWPNLKQRLLAGPLAAVVPEIDAASTKVVAHFADPGVRGLKKKGLVLGYVQSGKTANYTAVIAKAADAGYRTFIVMSGMHNNLRRQTQARIDRDLGTDSWVRLTDVTADFGSVLNGTALMTGGVHTIAVVKKNASRLRRLRDWLRDIDEDVRARCPILILDDEADQATPNSLAARDELSRINALIREIWAEIPTGSYVGYTATPFANVFMDPDDEKELYPSDFILDLPRSPDYFGAERIFGRTSLDDADEPDDGLDMVRVIPDDEADSLRPPSRRDEQSSFDPDVPVSLERAARWFVLASALRRLRGQQDQHNSMLVHTSAYVAPHFAMRARLVELTDRFRAEVDAGNLGPFEEVFHDEYGRVDPPLGAREVRWSEVSSVLPQILNELRVVVDNGISDDRLNYDRRDDEGVAVAETVIAVGGSTLSRGLTLEGLTVSYFIRSSNTYDTLLQMGRWFGYRPGYEDLPRIWMPEDLREDFMFLALVEEEIRRDMRRLEKMNVTPQQFGLRVRAHPGRLSITSRAKMAHADLVRISYAGQRHQTIVLHEGDAQSLERNLQVTRDLMRDCSAGFSAGQQTPDRTQFYGLPVARVIEFLNKFKFHPDQPGLRSDHVVGWLRTAASTTEWNVVVRGTSTPLRRKDGSTVDLGTADIGLKYEIPMVNRAPLSRPEASTGVANIKALLSQSDWLADLDPDLVSDLNTSGIRQEEYQRLRREYVGPNGLIIIYLVSNKSEPIRATQQGARRPMYAEVPLVGVGIIFPESDRFDTEGDSSYYSVRPDWTAVTDEEVDFPPDTEDSVKLDAAHLVGDAT